MKIQPFLPAMLLLAAGCTAQVQQGLDERQANELQTVLMERGFDARKVAKPGKKPTWAIEVDDDQARDAVRVLAELGLPRPKAPTTLEVLGKSALVPSAVEERSRMLAGLSGDLAQTLESVDGVVSASVHLVMPLPSRPGQPQGEAKASALLRVRPGSADRVQALREELRALVAGSVDGLEAEGVTLVVTEISTQVKPPGAGPSAVRRLRLLVMLLGVTVSVLAIVLVLLTMRARRMREKARSAPAAPQVSAPIFSPGIVQRAA